MCTLSWIHHSQGEFNGYRLCFNRDELNTRKPSQAPEIRHIKGVRVLAPRDGDFGGSWISVNEFGLSLALLNRYENPMPEIGGSLRSRGLLLMDLSTISALDQLIAQIKEHSLGCYRPFTLLALSPGSAALLVKWDGKICAVIENGEMEMPLTSSSYDTAAVEHSRRAHFRQLAHSAKSYDDALLFQYHHSHHPCPGALSTCMHRDDASTVSLSQIRVGRERIEFEYHPGAPCLDVRTEYRVMRRSDR